MGKLQVAPQPSSQPKHIIIAGGGLAGLSTSLGLSKLGYRITIVECRKEWLQQGSAFGLAANGRKALLELFHSPSSMDRLLEKGIHIEQMDSHLMVWYMLRDSLLDEVKECPLIDVKMGTTVESIDDMSDASGVKVVVKNVESGDAEKMDASLLVAADGVYSNIRTLIGLESAKVSASPTCASDVNFETHLRIQTTS
jgi:2-polyprenyl-6-methoxyphenol hydroxylase-like FAD-dependent oxidoreductase